MDPRFRRFLLILLPIIVLVGVLIWQPWNPGPVREDASTRPECPLTDTVLYVGARGGAPYKQLSVPGPVSHIPEFHDCQRFIVKGSNSTQHASSDGLVYDSLYAIFASYQLDGVGDTITGGQFVPISDPLSNGPDTGIAAIPAVRGPRGDTTRALSFAEIVSWGGTYGPLGIHPGFNCLYLYKTGTHWQAVMVAVRLEDLCLKPLHRLARDNFTDITAWQVLRVNAVSADRPGMRFAETDYPPVARWDWDRNRAEQFIGIRCGNAWCDVSASGTPALRETPTVETFERVTDLATGQLLAVTRPEESRVGVVRGWYDYQRLATRDGDHVVPSVIEGWLFPGPLLYKLDDKALFSDWVHSASAYVTGDYQNAAVRFRTGDNRIFLCRSTGTNCSGVPADVTPLASCDDPEVWWAKIVSDAAPGDPWFHRVCRRDHSDVTLPGFHIPGTARWRWLARDETTWKRCTEGCCELQE